MPTEYIVAILVLTCALAVAGLWRAGRTGSAFAWSAAFVGIISFASTFFYAAAPQINRPPEQVAEAYWRSRFEGADAERKATLAQLAKANESVDLVDGALKKANVATQERDTAQKAHADAVALGKSLELERDRGLAGRQRLEQQLAQADSDKAKLNERIRSVEERINTLDKALQTQTGARTLAEAALRSSNGQLRSLFARQTITQVRLRQASDRLTSTESEITSLRDQYAGLMGHAYDLMIQAATTPATQPEPPIIKTVAQTLLQQLQARIDTARYTIEPRPDLNLLVGRTGKYFSVTLRAGDGQTEFEFANVEPPLISNEQEFLDAVGMLSKEVLLTLERTTKLELFVRGGADTRPIRNQPDPAKFAAFRTYYAHKRIGSNRYAADKDPEPKEIKVPLENNDLPNLRAAFLATRLNKTVEATGTTARFSILDQIPEIAARKGEPQKIHPELFFFLPRL